ncbi:MAG: PQQ-binding-like beta-propeller repeat protein, partial [Mycobacterium sp.]|nr:PQQ-binding-like beta-propeller repeat protein [Mycobacterium sp.]
STAVTGARVVSLRWSRRVGSPLRQPVTLGKDGQMFLTTHADDPQSDLQCAMFAFQMETGRKRVCGRLGPDAISAPNILDGDTNVYVGDDSAVTSMNYLGQPRWVTPVAGVPVALQFTGDGNVVSITQSGQVDVLNRQNGRRVVPTTYLVGPPDPLVQPDLPWPPSGEGLSDCPTGGPGCAVASDAALDTAQERIYVTVRRPGAATAALVALQYAAGRVTQVWSSEILRDGSATSPTVSADGKTVYVGDNSKRLLAVEADTGKVRWEQALQWAPQRGISVSPDGVIIPAGDAGYLAAYRDQGTAASQIWQRTQVALRGQPVQSAGGTGYVVVAQGEGLALESFDTATGATTDTETLPTATDTTTGTALGANGEVVTATTGGEVYVFGPRGTDKTD